MNNTCEFKMKVSGKLSNLYTFAELIENHDVDQPHFSHIHSADMAYDPTTSALYIEGECERSVGQCMVNAFGTYPFYYEVSRPQSTDLKRVAASLGITIEVYSDAPAVGFAEHIIAAPNSLKYDTRRIILINIANYTTVKQLNEALGESFTNAEFQDALATGRLVKGSFKKEFTI